MLYPSPIEEAGALRRAASRAGCRVLELRGADGRVRGVVECPNGWGAARLLVALGAEDRTSPWARELAAELRALAGDDASYAQAILAFVKERLKFVREAPGAELFQSGPYSLLTGEGDCEDHARLVYALAVAGGLGARFAFLHRGGGPTHAVAQLRVNGAPTWAETTIDARLGEHPIDAGRRLGLLHSRSDITQGVQIMTEKNLKPIPPGFLLANNATQVQRDAQALAVLGYLSTDVAATISDPTDERFRLAVLAFQEKTGIKVDGLIGPQTRRTIAGALTPDEFGMGYVAATTSAAPLNARMVAAWPSLIEAARALAASGSIPALSDEAIAISMAIAHAETLLSNPPFVEANNWGNVTFNERRGEPFVSWGFIQSGDLNGQGQRVTRRFQAYPSLVDGAKDFLRIKLGGGLRGAQGKEEIRAAFAAADVDAIALAMLRNKYFEGLPQDTDRDGVPGTENDRAQQYANLIRRDLPSARASAPPGMAFGRGGGAGGIVAGVALALALGGAAYLVSR